MSRVFIFHYGSPLILHFCSLIHVTELFLLCFLNMSNYYPSFLKMRDLYVTLRLELEMSYFFFNFSISTELFSDPCKLRTLSDICSLSKEYEPIFWFIINLQENNVNIYLIFCLAYSLTLLITYSSPCIHRNSGGEALFYCMFVVYVCVGVCVLLEEVEIQ